MNRMIILIFLVAGCASRAPERLTSSLSEETKGGMIEIDYVRGNNFHRLVATAQSDSVLIELFQDTELTRKNRVEPAKYNVLSKQAEELLNSFKVEKKIANCRTPFVLKLKKENSMRMVEGCRSDEQGALLGKLIREAEHLVLSQ